jgi:hypothetical protein
MRRKKSILEKMFPHWMKYNQAIADITSAMNKEMVPELCVGDKVEIVNYGGMIYVWGENKPRGIDLMPELIGQKGIIDQVIDQQSEPKYSIKGPNKHAWYNRNQLKKL